MTLAELRQQFKDMLNRSDIDDTRADHFINMGIRRLERGLRLPFMEKSLAYTVDGDDDFLLAADHLELIGVFCNDVQLTRITPAEGGKLLQNPLSGTPTVYWRHGATMRLYPFPENDSVVEIRYYGEFENLGADDYETFELSVIPDVILYATLVYAADFYVDERKPIWQQTLSEIVKGVVDMAERDEFAGRDLRIGAPTDLEY